MAEPESTGTPPRREGGDAKARFKAFVKFLVLFAVVIAAAIIGYALPRTSLWRAIFPSAEFDVSSMNPAAVQEWGLASADHEIIATAVAACSKIFDLAVQPDYVRIQLRLDIAPDGRRYASVPRNPPDPKTLGVLVLTNFHRAAIYLSDSIARTRSESASNASANHSNMFWFQLAIVGIGAITTILISIKSISPSGQSEHSPNWYYWIGIAAIVFSSLGTAASALNSFYGPREAYLKSERSLSALRQLHSDIVARVTSTTDSEHPEKCPRFDPTNKDDPFGKQIQDWSIKFGAIVNASDTSASAQGSANPGASPGAPPKAP